MSCFLQKEDRIFVLLASTFLFVYAIKDDHAHFLVGAQEPHAR